MTQFVENVRLRVTLQFISGIRRVLQKLRKYFNSTAISTLTITA